LVERTSPKITGANITRGGSGVYPSTRRELSWAVIGRRYWSAGNGRRRREPTLSAGEHAVLWAVALGRVRRDCLCGRLEPHLLDGRQVAWPLRRLVGRGLVMMQPIGPPRLTLRGRELLAQWSGPALVGERH
jgi:hypothetical protein